MKKLKIATMILLTLGASACTTEPMRSSQPTYNQSYQYGTVSAIEHIDGSGRSTGIGAVIGGVAGGLLGNQVGGGRGKDVATVAGAVGGAIAGNEIEKRKNANQNRYRVSVRLDNGAYQTFEQNVNGDLRVGDRVRVESNQVVRY